MKKDRVAAFTDAVLAIIMTILVLELEKPTTINLLSFWKLRHSFFSYTLSFFWLGSMWVNIHNEWQGIEKINSKALWVTLVLLFFCSLIPYATDLVSRDFHNKVAQGFYGLFVLGVTFSNIWLSHVIESSNDSVQLSVEVMKKRRTLLWIDIGIKIIGLIISLTVYPPAMMFSVIIAAVFLMTGIKVLNLDWKEN